jgi:cell division septum initiation protein DivIVA
MDDLLAPLTPGRQFRRRLWGYRCDDVDRYVGDVVTTNRRIHEEVERLRADGDPIGRVSRDIASVLRAFTDSVARARDDAEADAARIRAEAEDHAAAALRAVTTRFAAVQQQRDTASEAVARALDALQAAMAALADVPSSPDVAAVTDDLVRVD